MDFDRYFLVFLKRGPRAAEFSEAELEDLQERHLAHLASLYERGIILTSGPFIVDPEYPMRGLVVFQGDTPEEEVRMHMEGDPMVQVGRLSVEILKWLTPAGRISWTFDGELEDEVIEEGS